MRPLSVFLVGTRETFRCLQYPWRKPEPGNDDIIHHFNVKIIIQIRPHLTSHGYLLYNFLFPNQAMQAMRRHETSRYSRCLRHVLLSFFSISFGFSFSLSCSQPVVVGHGPQSMMGLSLDLSSVAMNLRTVRISKSEKNQLQELEIRKMEVSPILVVKLSFVYI